MCHEGKREALEGRKGASRRHKGGQLGEQYRPSVGAREVVQQVKCLSNKHQDLDFISRIH